MRKGFLKRGIARYGVSVVLIHHKERLEIQALIRPVLGQERLEIATPLGMTRREKFLYFALPEAAIESGDLVEYRDDCYEVQTVQGNFVGNELTHWRGILLHCGKKALS